MLSIRGVFFPGPGIGILLVAASEEVGFSKKAVNEGGGEGRKKRKNLVLTVVSIVNNERVIS